MNENKISSFQKGENFETKVSELVKSMLVEDKLPIIGKFSSIYRKKGYYSEQRKSNIIVDISIECTLPNETQPSLYLMIECKDYSHPVPVNDIEEFCNKTQQITGLNVKAIFFTTNVLQEGALNVAISNGIRIMRIKPDGNSEVLSFRKERTSVSDRNKEIINAFLALTSSAKSSISPTYVGIGPNSVYNSIDELIYDAIT